MRPLFLIIVLAFVVLLGGGLLLLGAFPPHLASQAVVHTLPNDRFQGH